MKRKLWDPSIGLPYSERGGLRWVDGLFGGLFVSWPFAQLHCTRTQCTLGLGLWHPSPKFVFERSDIIAIHRKRKGLWFAARIEHRRAEYPALIEYGTFIYPRLQEHLRSLGYPA